ncbi:MAG: DUF4037 domain-containing protein [Clostridia bacterium]|nr:DUF4037 domain-containing protein [Clostridia bacterium]
MKGIELSERFYKEHGEPMLKERFPELLPLIAVGLAGAGSECFGYDDEVSRDHDFEPGFCIFLPSEDLLDRKAEFSLERAYSKLPREFMGYKRTPLSPVGGNRHGVIRSAEFFSKCAGSPDGTLSLREWFFLPEQSLAEATNGKIFYDGLGEVSAIRARLSYMPQDVRLKKLAGNLLVMGQAGQYNYPRCIARGESAAAQLAAVEFAKATLNVAFLINRRYAPYYKWSFRALSALERLSEIYSPLEYLISSGNGEEAEKKQSIIEEICALVIAELRREGITSATCDSAESHAYSVNDRITDGEIRNLHILYAV